MFQELKTKIELLKNELPRAKATWFRKLAYSYSYWIVHEPAIGYRSRERIAKYLSTYSNRPVNIRIYELIHRTLK